MPPPLGYCSSRKCVGVPLSRCANTDVPLLHFGQPDASTVVGPQARITAVNFYPVLILETLQSTGQLGAEGHLGQFDTC